MTRTTENINPLSATKKTMNLRIVTILFTIILFSCKKVNDDSGFKQRITGDWELEQVICGECLIPIDSFPAGNGHIIRLLMDGSFERRLHDSITFRGHYDIQQKKDCIPRRQNFLFVTDETFTISRYVEEENQKLRFSIPNCYADGGDMIYRRIK
jgi:hypothetical protein